MTPAAARHNSAILRNVQFDMHRALSNEHPLSPLQFGSEFRTTQSLAPLLAHHPNWYRIHQLLDDGCEFLASTLSETDRLRQIDLALDFGNHKGACKAPDKLRALLLTDVTHGFNLPLDLSLARKMPGLVLSPMNIAPQQSIDETGRIIEKDRLTHDHSFDFFPNSAINNRCALDLHEPCMFGHALSRIFHWTVHLRTRYPSQRLLITKTDWKAAYRRGHLAIATALQCATHVDDLLLLPLRMTFGGAPCPSQWSILSDTGGDLATDIANHPDWKPLELHSPHQHRLPPLPPCPLDRPPPHPAQELLFDFPPADDDLVIKFDNYIDDLIGVGVELDTDSTDRLAAAGSLVIHTLARPVAPNEPIPRDDPNSLTKLAAEGLPEEVKIVLGIRINTYTLLASLPRHKFTAWLRDVHTTMAAGKVSHKALEQLIGRLEHVCLILHPGRHFLGSLRGLLLSFGAQRYGTRKLSTETIKDLKLWKNLLKRAVAGVSLNLLVFRNPTHAYRSDACECGLGGYSSTGRAWRHIIPADLLGRASINLLEFIGTLIGPWFDSLEGQLPPEASIFSQGDNTTASSWCHRSNFDATDRPAHLRVARKWAMLQLQAKVQLVNEWLAGQHNEIADSLSRDTHLEPRVHARLLSAHFPTQIQDGFHIAPLPTEITLWINSTLRNLPATRESCHKSKRSALVCGTDGLPIWPAITELRIPSSVDSSRSPTSNPLSLAASPKPFDPVNCSSIARKAWLATRCQVTSTNWYKPSGIISNPTQPSIPMDPFRRFYRGSSPVTGTWIQPQPAKRPSASTS
jgi:hypothetical protein